MNNLKNSLLNKYKSVTAWGKLLFSHKGKIGRLEFFISHLIILIFFIAFNIGSAFFIIHVFDDGNFARIPFPHIRAFLLLFLASAILSCFVLANITVKRFCDLGKSIWFAFTVFIPVVNIYFYFLLLFKKGKP